MYNVDAAVPLTLTYEFDVTIIDGCKDSALAFSPSEQADEPFIIDAAPTTATQSILFAAVTTTTSIVLCPISIEMEIYSNFVWVSANNVGLFPWIPSYTSGTGFDLQTDDAATLADPANA